MGRSGARAGGSAGAPLRPGRSSGALLRPTGGSAGALLRPAGGSIGALLRPAGGSAGAPLRVGRSAGAPLRAAAPPANAAAAPPMFGRARSEGPSAGRAGLSGRARRRPWRGSPFGAWGACEPAAGGAQPGGGVAGGVPGFGGGAGRERRDAPSGAVQPRGSDCSAGPGGMFWGGRAARRGFDACGGCGAWGAWGACGGSGSAARRWLEPLPGALPCLESRSMTRVPPVPSSPSARLRRPVEAAVAFSATSSSGRERRCPNSPCRGSCGTRFPSHLRKPTVCDYCRRARYPPTRIGRRLRDSTADRPN
ncbi:hypothetical protein SAMN05216215_1007223 [Saccharopolyspora shandongensis]|uniref:Uncharacterized protein n=1 Tax=Saccharopolyspora shandongensis TaxID=418495 RepID=A0A1H2Z1B4_9PSEU|nr:hypothetical protein SAMN05216215_1007223 [Saccharopolyspora shandongensis]